MWVHSESVTQDPLVWATTPSGVCINLTEANWRDLNKTALFIFDKKLVRRVYLRS